MIKYQEDQICKRFGDVQNFFTVGFQSRLKTSYIWKEYCGKMTKLTETSKTH